MTYRERLKELRLISLKKRKIKGDLKADFKYLKGNYKKNEKSLFSVAEGDRTRSNGVKLW